ncbi:hypothetical protein K438DRAFT_1929589 [Mycena galopus ATCC 62051]|nr:hypothetical protein K438DRAFT_1929589 [Mycena galopus ATCC 62051]
MRLGKQLPARVKTVHRDEARQSGDRQRHLRLGDLVLRAPVSNGNGGLAFVARGAPEAGGFSTASPMQADANINPLAIKQALPAVTSSGSAGQGLNWVQQMIGAWDMAGATTNIPTLYHWYGKNFADFQNHVIDAHSRFPEKQIVVSDSGLRSGTRLAGKLPGNSSSQTQLFMPSFDSAPFVVPFTVTAPNLFNANDAEPGYVGTGSTLYDNDRAISTARQLLLSAQVMHGCK